MPREVGTEQYLTKAVVDEAAVVEEDAEDAVDADVVMAEVAKETTPATTTPQEKPARTGIHANTNTVHRRQGHTSPLTPTKRK